MPKGTGLFGGGTLLSGCPPLVHTLRTYAYKLSAPGKNLLQPCPAKEGSMPWHRPHTGGSRPCVARQLRTGLLLFHEEQMLLWGRPKNQGWLAVGLATRLDTHLPCSMGGPFSCYSSEALSFHSPLPSPHLFASADGDPVWPKPATRCNFSSL